MTSNEDPLLVEVRQGTMFSPVHTVLVRPYLYGQFRIQLTRIDKPEPYAPEGHGTIVRELCTYRQDIMIETVARLAVASDPEEACRDMERPWNCDAPGRGRIRLDNEDEWGKGKRA